MKIKSLSLRNIRSYENLSLTFPEGSVLLSGDVGSGKSSILLAIEYALFGLQPGQKGSSLLRNSSDIGEVFLELDIDGIPVIIERKLKRSSKGVANEYASITINGKKEESSVTEVKTRILDLLEYPKEFIKKNNLLYRYTVFTPQEQMKQIILEDSEVRLNIIRHIFGIDKYRNIVENLSLLLNFIKESSKTMQGEIKGLERETEMIDEKGILILDLENRIISARETMAEKSLALSKISVEIDELEKKILEKHNLEKEVEKATILKNTKIDSILSLRKEVQEIESFLLGQKESYDSALAEKITERIKNISFQLESAESSYINIISLINSLENECAEISKKKDEIFKIQTCPTCLQNVPDEHKHNILKDYENNLSQTRRKILSLNSEKSSLFGFIESLKKEQSEIMQKNLSMEVLKSREEYTRKSTERLETLNKSRTIFEGDIILLEKHLSSLKENILKFSVFDSQLKRARLAHKDALQEEKNAAIYEAELKKELELTRKDISQLEESRNYKLGVKKKLSSILELEAWLSGSFLSLIEFTERNILINLRIEFSKVFSSWFSALVPEESFQVRLDESFSPILIHNETEMEYSFLSGGERTALALAYRLALNQIINSLLSRIKTRELVILDEPTEGFSEAQIGRMREIFSGLNVSQLIIVSHESKIEGLVDNIIRVSKSGGLSSIGTGID